MADFLPDDIVCNIIARLPAKPLLRFRCVSKYWNGMLTEPNFMKLRSRKTIMIPLQYTFLLIDGDTCNWRYFPFDTQRKRLKVIGTLNGIGNGIVVLAFLNFHILYNPFTGVFKELPGPPAPCHRGGYGLDPDGLKIVRFRQHYKIYDVYDITHNSWSSNSISEESNIFIKFEYDLGHFVNGSLYWIAYNRSVLIVFHVKDMLLSEICLPFKIDRRLHLNPLGTINGCLCSLHRVTKSGFDMWVMKEQDHWIKIYSFELDLDYVKPVRILDSRRILMVDPSGNLIMYDTSKRSYKSVNILMEKDEVQALEYVETLENAFL